MSEGVEPNTNDKSQDKLYGQSRCLHFCIWCLAEGVEVKRPWWSHKTQHESNQKGLLSILYLLFVGSQKAGWYNIKDKGQDIKTKQLKTFLYLLFVGWC